MRSNSIDMSAGVVAYETDPGELETALSAITGAPVRTEVYVFDNSADDRLRATAQRCGARYIFNGRNIGFGAAHNRIFARVAGRSKLHLILNSDIVVSPADISELAAFMAFNPQVGCVMPRVTYPDGSEQFLCKRLATPLDLVLRRAFGRRLAHSARMRRYECRDLDLSSPSSVPCLSGCFLLLRSECLEEVGGFDERFFLYMEDFDLARRIGERWETVYYPQVTIGHRHARGSYARADLLARHIVSAVRYFNKWGWFYDPERRRRNASAGMRSQTRAYELPASGAAGVERLVRFGSEAAIPSAPELAAHEVGSR